MGGQAMGMVIGKGGAKVRELEAAFAVRIDTVPGYSSVTIKGAPAAIAAASLRSERSANSL